MHNTCTASFYLLLVFLFKCAYSTAQQSLCMGSQHLYTVDISENNGTGTAGSSYQWQVVSSNFMGIVTPQTISGNQIVIDWLQTPSGVYTLQVTEINNLGCTNTKNLQVTIFDQIEYDIQNQFLCQTAAGEIIPKILNTGLSLTTFQHQWFMGSELISNTNSLQINQPGNYTLFLNSTQPGGCSKEIHFTVSVSTPLTSIYNITSDFDLNQSLVLTTTGGIPPYLYRIDDGPFQSEPTFQITAPSTFTVEVTDASNCNSNFIAIELFYYPPFFTPNLDGHNDFWNIEIPSGLPPAKVTIFDRYGKLIYFTYSNKIGWDGTYQNRNLPSTDYWFTIDYVDQFGNNKQYKSHFSLIR